MLSALQKWIREIEEAEGALMSMGFGLGVSGKSHMTVVRRQNRIVTTLATPPSHPRRIHRSRCICLLRRRSWTAGIANEMLPRMMQVEMMEP